MKRYKDLLESIKKNKDVGDLQGWRVCLVLNLASQKSFICFGMREEAAIVKDRQLDNFPESIQT